jgi:hypothetical protein
MPKDQVERFKKACLCGKEAFRILNSVKRNKNNEVNKDDLGS